MARSNLYLIPMIIGILLIILSLTSIGLTFRRKLKQRRDPSKLSGSQSAPVETNQLEVNGRRALLNSNGRINSVNKKIPSEFDGVKYNQDKFDSLNKLKVEAQNQVNLKKQEILDMLYPIGARESKYVIKYDNLQIEMLDLVKKLELAELKVDKYIAHYSENFEERLIK